MNSAALSQIADWIKQSQRTAVLTHMKLQWRPGTGQHRQMNKITLTIYNESNTFRSETQSVN